MSAPDGAPKRRGGRIRNHEVAAAVIRAVRSARDDITAQNKVALEEIRGLRAEVKGLTEAVGELADASRALLAARAVPAGPSAAAASPATATTKPAAKKTGKDT